MLFTALALYNVIQKVVTEINYDVERNKFVIKQLSSWSLKEREHIFNPEDIVKHYKKSINPTIGYKTKKPEELKLATELNKDNWLDRRFFDTMIFQIVDKQTEESTKKEVPDILQ